MKIGILTLHRANNYGAVLQCYALQETLRSLGHDVRVIDYRQPDTEQSYQVFSWAKLKQSSGNARSFLKALLYIPYSFVQQKGFNHFRKRYLKTTLPMWRADDMPQDMDVYVIGSDQLWSVQCMGGHLEPVFFGQFPHSEKSCVVGYAISSNIPSLQTIGVDRIKQYLASFRCISLREASICSWIKEQTGFSVRQDIDPTMLLDPKQWDAFVGSKPVEDDYVLMYFLLPQQKKLAEEFARKQGLRLIEVGKVAFSPEKFLTYVKHATYVLGGSFHVAVFSIMFQKRFYIIKKNSEFDVRSEHLLRSLGLEERFIDVSELASLDVAEAQPIDFTDVESKLSILKEHSLNYLRSL